jgi:hypothetical protein
MLAWLDFITGAHHREVCAQYDSRLAAAVDRIREAEGREESERAERRKLEQELIAHIFPRRQAAAERPKARSVDESPMRTVQMPIDPNDDAALVRQAMRETGSRNARVVAARAQRMKDMAMRGERVTEKKRIAIPQNQVETMIRNALAEGEREGMAVVGESQAS